MGAMELSPLEGFKKGDIVIISDPITQEEFGASRVQFKVRSVRTYAKTDENIKYTCYVLDNLEEDDFFMLVIKEIDNFYGIYLYYLDNEGAVNPPKERKGIDTPNYDNVVDPEKDDFADIIIIANNEGDVIREIQWNQSEYPHMHLSYYDEEIRGEASLCEYFTDGENYGNDLALVICKGSLKKGHVQMWYGYGLQNQEAELFPAGTEVTGGEDNEMSSM